MGQVQAERQKKSVLQMCMIFHARAEDIHRDGIGRNILEGDFSFR